MNDSIKGWLALAVAVAALIVALYHHHTSKGTVRVG